MLHVTLFYSALSPSFSLFRFYFCLVTFLLCIISLRFTLLYALLSSFSSALSFTLFVLCISPPLRSLYGLFYPTLLYFHSTIFPFALHCFVSLHYLASIYLISPCFPYFSWSSFRSGFNLISSWGHRASFHSLLNLLRWASRHSTPPPYSALLRLAWTPGFGEIRAGLTALCNLLAVQERNEAQAALLILRNAF